MEEDIGTYNNKAVDGPKTLNKNLYLRPPNNVYSFNEIVALWEKKIGKTLNKFYIREEKLFKDIEDWYRKCRLIKLMLFPMFKYIRLIKL